MVINVMMAEWKMATAPDTLKTSGLGSCVAVTIYDRVMKMAAMAHVMLPHTDDTNLTADKAGKYANTAIPVMVQVLRRKGANPARLIAKMAGGAQMFAFGVQSEALSIGKRNVEACLKALEQYEIPVVSCDTGGRNGRTVEFFCSDGQLHIKTFNQGVKTL